MPKNMCVNPTLSKYLDYKHVIAKKNVGSRVNDEILPDSNK